VRYVHRCEQLGPISSTIHLIEPRLVGIPQEINIHVHASVSLLPELGLFKILPASVVLATYISLSFSFQKIFQVHHVFCLAALETSFMIADTGTASDNAYEITHDPDL
jgi:hypothetical protein